MIRQARADKMKRNGLRITLGIAVALIAVVGIAWLGGAFDSDDDDTLTGADPSSTGARPVRRRHPPDRQPAARQPPTVPVEQTTVPRELPAPPADPSECPAADGSAAQQREFTAAPPLCIDPAKSYTALVSTNHGDFTVELDPAAAPITVNNFVVLARYHYFDDTICHRIIPGFVVQCGDPDGDRFGRPRIHDPRRTAGSPVRTRSVRWRWRTAAADTERQPVLRDHRRETAPASSRTTACSARSPTASTTPSSPSMRSATPTRPPTACRRWRRSASSPSPSPRPDPRSVCSTAVAVWQTFGNVDEVTDG